MYSITLGISNLNGDKYQIWMYKMELLLRKENLWDVVTNDRPEDNKGKWESRNVNAEEPRAKKKKFNYNDKRKFKEVWKDKFKWLEKDTKSEKSYRRAYSKVINGGIIHIERHKKTKFMKLM
ncbi:hypothetical protein ILUMI_17396 [Ignelater luminosus]|uniref:DUF4219 domain-containing protein n=1 Tax=Ignelater luminosus TaxID=2038154 RepID=A0A8K0G535_IGNLU|nr:hypothetical protein ILUMI_17396 [Ignelater luminosus]